MFCVPKSLKRVGYALNVSIDAKPYWKFLFLVLKSTKKGLFWFKACRTHLNINISWMKRSITSDWPMKKMANSSFNDNASILKGSDVALYCV